MNRCIAFLRAINVGGNSAIPMRGLVSMLEGLGAHQVHTYLQSGNVVFQSADNDPAQLSRQLAAEINQLHGFEPQTFILSLDALRRAHADCPFSAEADAEPTSVHLGFFAAKPLQPNIEKMDSLKKDSERFFLGDGVFYLHAPEGVGKSKLAASAEKLLGVPMTMRNWRTVCKVIALAES